MSQYSKKCCPTFSQNVGNYTNYTDYIKSQKTCNLVTTECKRGPQGPIGPPGVPGSATYTGATGPPGPPALGTNVAARYYSLVTQQIANNTPTIFSFEMVGFQLGITKNSENNKIVIQNTGIYEISYSVQLHSTNSKDVCVYIWLIKNGAELPGTNNCVQIKSNMYNTPSNVPYILNLNIGDTISFSSQTNANLCGDVHASHSSNITVPGPDIPSIVVGIKKIATDIGGTTSKIKTNDCCCCDNDNVIHGTKENAGQTNLTKNGGMYTIFTSATLDGSTLSLNNNNTIINIPNATIIYINNNTDKTRFITNINGGVDGRMIIFSCSLTSCNNGTIIFTNEYSKNGTGIFLGEFSPEKFIKLTSGKSICFIYMAEASLPNDKRFKNAGDGKGLWMLQYYNC
jgi:hypothetical protein